MNGYFSALLRSSGLADAPALAVHEPAPIVEPPMAAEPAALEAGPAPPEPHRESVARAAMPPPAQPAPSMEPAVPAPATEHTRAAPPTAASDTRPATDVPVEAADAVTPVARAQWHTHLESPARDVSEAPARVAPVVPPADALLRAARRWVAADPALAAPAPVALAATPALPVVRAAAPLPLPNGPLAEAVGTPRLAATPSQPLRWPDPPAPHAAAPARDVARLEPLPPTDHSAWSPRTGAVEVSIGAIHVTVDAPPSPVGLQTPARAAAPAPAHTAARSALARRSLRRI